jgi:hypothetical protein
MSRMSGIVGVSRAYARRPSRRDNHALHSGSHIATNNDSNR